MISRIVEDTGAWLGGKRGDDGEWFWLDGKNWQYQNWYPKKWDTTTGDQCLYYGGNGLWFTDNCIRSMYFICATNKQMTSGNHTFVLEKAFLGEPNFQFWWNHTPDNLSKQPRGLQISWKIENGSLPDVKELVSTDLSGSATTPGLGSIAPPDFYKEKHEYSVVIDLPNNITDVIGYDVFVVEIDLISPEEDVQLITTTLNYEFNHIEMNWTDAEAFCVSKGGHLASVSTPQDWQNLQEFYTEVLPEGKDYDDFLYLWLGGTDQEKEGEWKWTDKSKWSEEHWMVDEPINDREDKDYLQLVASKSTGSEWIAWYESNETAESICQIPITMMIRESTCLFFSSKNVSSLQLTWIADAQAGRDTSNHNNDSIINGFHVRWHIVGYKDPHQESKGKEMNIWKERDQRESERSYLGRCANNQNGNLKWYLP